MVLNQYVMVNYIINNNKLFKNQNKQNIKIITI